MGPAETMIPLIPIFGMLTGVLTTGFLAWGLVRVFQGPVGQALARRIQAKSGGGDPEVLHEVLELRSQVEELSHRLGEAEERLDFSERLLAQRSGSSVEGNR